MATLPQIVIDTNVIVAAVRSRRGASAALLAMVGTARFAINLSVALALEYEEVLKRHGPPVGITGDEADDLVAFLCAHGNRREPVAKVRPLIDDPDDEFLAELAVSFDCDYLVTHNLRHLAPLQAHGIGVVTPGQFLGIIGEQT